MGNSANVAALSREDIHGIANFGERDIVRLYNRFRALDADGSGQLDPSEIFSVAELNENPLVQRVISVFDADNSGTVSFIEFLVGLAKLAAGTSEEHKLSFAFNIYDVYVVCGLHSEFMVCHAMLCIHFSNLTFASILILTNKLKISNSNILTLNIPLYLL